MKYNTCQLPLANELTVNMCLLEYFTVKNIDVIASSAIAKEQMHQTMSFFVIGNNVECTKLLYKENNHSTSSTQDYFV